jgi:uncharacterized membrane protein
VLIKKILYFQIPEYFTTILISAVGVFFLILGFFLEPSFEKYLKSLVFTPVFFLIYPLAKAITVDSIRIYRCETLAIPGYVYWVYGIQTLCYIGIWALTHEGLVFSSGTPKSMNISRIQ